MGTWTAKDKTKVTIRTILPEDEAVLADQTVFMRYLHPMMLQERGMQERLARICHCDYDREIALLAETTNVAGEQDLMGEVRLSKMHGTNEARLSILIGDPYQGIGLGSEMVRGAVKVAQHDGLNHVNTILIADNQLMLHIFQKLGFSFQPGIMKN